MTCCQGKNCGNEATTAFLANHYCPKHQAIEVEIHRFITGSTDNALNGDGSYRVLLTEEMEKDDRVIARIKDLAPEREKRQLVVAAADKLVAASKKTSDILATRQARGSAIASNLSVNYEVRAAQMRKVLVDSPEIFPYAVDAWDALVELSRQKQGKTPTAKLWDLIAVAVNHKPNTVRHDLARIAYGGFPNYLSLDNLRAAAKHLNGQVLSYTDSTNMADVTFVQLMLEKFLAERSSVPARTEQVLESIHMTNDKAPLAPKESLSTRIVAAAKEDSADMAYRVAAKQAARLVRDPVAAAIATYFGGSTKEKNKLREKILEAFSTDLGLGVVLLLLGMALSAVPIDDERMKILAKEARVAGLAAFGDIGAEFIMGPIREIVVNLVKGLPPLQESDTRIRVEMSDIAKLDARQKELEEELAEIEQARVTARSMTQSA